MSVSPSLSSSGKRTRVLEVMVKSAKLHGKNIKGEIYVKLWINRGTDLETNNVSCIDTLNNFSWNQKFVFSVPHTFPLNDNSYVVFEVFRAGARFSDPLIGVAKCQVRPLFEEKEVNEVEEEKVEVKYDTEKEEDDDDDHDNADREEEEEVVVPPEVKKSARIPIISKKGSKGYLEVGLVLWKGCISRVGKFKWHNPAMDYDEFLGLGNNDGGKHSKKNDKKQHCTWVCWC